MFNSGDDNSSDVYFASKPASATASVLLGRAESFYNVLTANYYLSKINMMWRAYHGAYNDSMGFGHRIDFTGEQGELVSMPVNHFRNLAQHIYVMITANRPVMDARAVNTDYKSLAQTYLATGILEYYMREKGLENAIKKATEMAIVTGSGFIKLDWNATAGEAYDHDEETGEFNYEGEVEFTNLSPLDVVVDGTKETWDNEWILVRTWKNRFDLIAKYPEFADKIKSIPPKSQSTVYRLAVFTNDETDDIPIYEFYHKKTEAMPNGRYLLFLDADIVLLDTKMPYREIPVFRIVPSEIMGTPYGYSPMFDIFPIQEAINSLYSTIMTNQNAFGVQNIYVQRGADINWTQLEGAMNVIEANSKPEALNLTSTPPEVFKFLDYLIHTAETLSGVNSVARGNPEASLKSGNALALVQSMALQFMSGLQQSYVELIEDVGSSVINILKDFATTPKVVALVGKNNRPLLKEFTGESISAINRVVVDVGNPLSRCLAKDTPILMYDGSTVMVQDIKINDLVMGPDSKPRTVYCTNSDQEMMYEVTSKDSNRNIKYGCNESHILTLKYCSDDYRYNAKKGNILDISVKDYIKLTNRQKRLLQGFTTGVEFSSKNLTVPPYILGAWLGDGYSNTTCITTMDKEIETEWTNYAYSLGLEVRIQENTQSNKAKNYHITSGISHGKSDRNSFMNELRSMEVINNKHIPDIYLKGSMEQRLELLAGLIDTDGTLIDETFIFTQKSNKLSDNVIFLAKSLGFRVTTKKRPSDSGPSKDGSPRRIIGETNVISIGGDTHKIPTRLPRKQAKKKIKARDWLNYGIQVNEVGFGTYYGFTLKEEPHFLLGDFTVTHNTLAGRVQMAEQMMQMGIIKDPQQYFQVMNTGRIDSMYEGEMSEIMLIKSENEQMLEGQDPIVSPLDSHKQHITEHRAVLADPELRKDQSLVKAVIDHIEKHMDALRNTDPALLQLVGEQPLPPAQPPQSQMGPQGPVQPGPGAPGPNGPQPHPQQSHGGAHNVMKPPQQGQTPPGTPVNGPQGTERMPNVPKINGQLLPNPAAQQASTGNVK